MRKSILQTFNTGESLSSVSKGKTTTDAPLARTLRMVRFNSIQTSSDQSIVGTSNFTLQT